MAGDRNFLNNYDSYTAAQLHNQKPQRRGQPSRFNRTTKLVSARRTDSKAQSIMPKTAINFYNLRKGLYIKNGNTGSLSRDANKMVGSHDQFIAKSTGILNAYGELAA